MHMQHYSTTYSLTAKWKTKLGTATMWGIYYITMKRNEVLTHAIIIINIPTPCKDRISCSPGYSKTF